MGVRPKSARGDYEPLWAIVSLCEHMEPMSLCEGSVWEGAHVCGGRSLWEGWRTLAAFDFAPIQDLLSRIVL